MKTTIHIYYHLLRPDSPTTTVAALCPQLPDDVVARASRYKSNTAALQHLIGRLLLRDGLQKINSPDTLASLSYTDQGKPILAHTQFNISHSGHIVLCAFSSHGAIGVDVELPSSADPQHLKHSFTDKEWQLIQQDSAKLYELWTRKEGIIKASDYKLQDLHKIDTSYFDEQVSLEGGTWYLRSLDFLRGQGAYSAVCSEGEIGEVVVEECFF